MLADQTRLRATWEPPMPSILRIAAQP